MEYGPYENDNGNPVSLETWSLLCTMGADKVKVKKKEKKSENQQSPPPVSRRLGDCVVGGGSAQRVPSPHNPTNENLQRQPIRADSTGCQLGCQSL